MTTVPATRSRPPRRLLSEEDARDIAVEAYVYAYPLVLMEVTRRVSTNVPRPEEQRAPVNRFGHMSRFPDASFTDIVSPNADTLDSMLWFDVSSEPLVIEKPASAGRYHLLPILDMWTDVFASPGSRTTGDEAERFAIVGPRWIGNLPREVNEVRSPTEQGWIIGRTRTSGRSDYADVHVFQNALIASPLRDYGSDCSPRDAPVDTGMDMSAPVEQVARLSAANFFSLFALTTRKNPPHAHDYPMLARMRRLGLEPGKIFDLSQVSPMARSALEAAPAIAMKSMELELFQNASKMNGWRFIAQPVGTYGANYLHRASVALNGLGANVAEDASYATMTADTDGNPLDSGARYQLRFDNGQTPPVRAFWSLSIYDEKRFFAENPINRYAIGDRDALSFNEDGSLDISIQRDDPGGARRSNWLPAPMRGTFALTLRLYWPGREIINGHWKPPVLRRVTS